MYVCGRVILFDCEIEWESGHKSNRLVYFKESRPPWSLMSLSCSRLVQGDKSCYNKSSKNCILTFCFQLPNVKAGEWRPSQTHFH